MVLYRLASRPYPLDHGEGARLYGGRWNHRGTPMIYASAMRSLAAFEVIAHRGALPGDHHVIRMDVPQDLTIEVVTMAALPRR